VWPDKNGVKSGNFQQLIKVFDRRDAFDIDDAKFSGIVVFKIFITLLFNLKVIL